MKNKRYLFLFTVCFNLMNLLSAQEYNYSINLNKVDNDQLLVELVNPPIKQKSVNFYIPKIIPGTYRVSDYGMFISEFSAFDKKGKKLPVNQTSTNSWKIDNAHKLVKVSYKVDDIFDHEENSIFMMAASNIEKDKNFVIHPPAFFGYFEEMKKLPFVISITKPVNFYGSTGLTALSQTPETDKFRTRDYDQLADSPFMYNVPDTTFIKVGNANVLVSVYSPEKKVTSAFLASNFEKLLQAHKRYLGDELPVDKYAFILYFADPKTASPMQGALEHNQSSFYYFSEVPQETFAPYIVDIASHEFFHIITPLTIHSNEIADFNFNEPVLSQHLWLYEGVTEYASDHVQVRSNLNSPEEFLGKLSGKINNSLGNYNDNLPFTELSRESAGKHLNQFGNVYEKGALIATVLDIRLIELSKGKMDLQDLVLALSKKYGINNPFQDDKLFQVIEEMTYPEIGQFFRDYVSGSKSIPYKEYFEKVGINYTKDADKKAATLGRIGLGFNQEKQKIEITNIQQMNDFGKAMGYETGDLLISIKGEEVVPATFNAFLENFNSNTPENEIIKIKVLRKTDGGDYKEVELSAPALLINVVGKATLTMDPNATAQQLKYRAVWLQENPVAVSPEDVKTVDAVIASLYDVISGPAGERNWDRFYSLFTQEAKMAAMLPTQNGTLTYKMFNPKDYVAMNSPYLMQNGFFEKEIGRQENRFGEIAHVWSAYEYSAELNGTPEQRGINSIQLVFDQGRWWITNILWNSERPDNKIPENL